MVDVNPRVTTSVVGIAAVMEEEIADVLVAASRGRDRGGPPHGSRPVRDRRHGDPAVIGIDVGGANLKVAATREARSLLPALDGRANRGPSQSVPGARRRPS